MDCWLPTPHLHAAAAPYHEVIDQDDDSYQQEQMNQGASDVDDDETEQPQHEQNEHDAPQHSRYPISNNSTAPQRESILRAKEALRRGSLGTPLSSRYL